MSDFPRMLRLPPYVFAVVGDLKMQLRRQNIDIVDFSMGNPDIPTPQHIVDKLVEAVQKPVNHRYSASAGIPGLREANVAVSPGLGFGSYGDEFVRFALIENQQRTKQAVKGIKKALSGGSCAD